MPAACGYVPLGMAFCPHARGDDSFDTTFAALDPVIGAGFPAKPRQSSRYAPGICMI
jgi:hypothetical protein